MMAPETEICLGGIKFLEKSEIQRFRIHLLAIWPAKLMKTEEFQAKSNSRPTCRDNSWHAEVREAAKRRLPSVKLCFRTKCASNEEVAKLLL